MNTISEDQTKLEIPVDQFGKDHWSMLAFVETRCVDYKGQLDSDRMRCNPHAHPQQYALRVYPRLEFISGWKPEWGTHLKNGEVLADHDDWNCLNDLEAAGLVETLSFTNGNVRLTAGGLRVAQQLRVFKAQGGQYKHFQFLEMEEKEVPPDEAAEQIEQDRKTPAPQGRNHE